MKLFSELVMQPSRLRPFRYIFCRIIQILVTWVALPLGNLALKGRNVQSIKRSVRTHHIYCLSYHVVFLLFTCVSGPYSQYVNPDLGFFLLHAYFRYSLFFADSSIYAGCSGSVSFWASWILIWIPKYLHSFVTSLWFVIFRELM